MNEETLQHFKSLFLVGHVLEATAEKATIQFEQTVLTDIPILYPAGLKQTLRPGMKALLLCPAGEMDHAALIPLGGAPHHQLYDRLNELLKLFNELLNTLHSNALKQVRGGDEGASAAAYLIHLKSGLEALQTQWREQFDPLDNPLGFIAQEP